MTAASGQQRPSEYTLELTLHDNRGYNPPIQMCIDLIDEVRIASLTLDEMRSGLGTIPLKATVEFMRRRVFRRDLFISTAQRLGALMAERMEDAEGWDDEGPS